MTYPVLGNKVDSHNRILGENGKPFSGVGLDDGEICYLKDGWWHRELGPARPEGVYKYWLKGNYYEEKAYWKKMYKKYRGTEHEELCIANLLGSK